VGTVQREIRVGMSGAEVITVLGPPNIVTTDAERREVWTYDRIATETVYSSSAGAASLPLYWVWVVRSSGAWRRESRDGVSLLRVAVVVVVRGSRA
jgi:hypothetical protein